MMKKQLLTTIILVFCGLTAFGQVTLSGKVTDEKGEPMVGAIVAVFKNGVSKTGAQADFDGVFRINNLDPGKYDVECSMLGSVTQRTTGVQLTTGLIILNFMDRLRPGLELVPAEILVARLDLAEPRHHVVEVVAGILELGGQHRELLAQYRDLTRARAGLGDDAAAL